MIKSGKHGAATLAYTDSGLTDLLAELEALDSLVLSVGVLGGERYPDGTSVATVAAILEFGSDDNPARPFMRRAVEANASKIAAVQSLELGRVAMGEQTAVGALAAIGKAIAGYMVEGIDRASSWAAPNAPTTIKSKGSSSPLRETGKLRASISWVITTTTGATVRTGKP